MTDESRLNELLDRWEDLRRQGVASSPDSLCADSPELAAELRRRLAALGQVDAMMGNGQSPTAESIDAGAAAGPPPSPAIEPAVSPYRNLRFHACGGLGEVFRAHDEVLGRDVALKTIQARSAGSAEGRRRFERESAITGRLEHPGVAPVHASGHCADGRPYYVMRFIDGETLGKAIQRFHSGDAAGADPGARTLAFRGLLNRFVQVCQTIEYAHGRGVLHRDIKPSNVMLGPHGETLVVNWGLAKVVGERDDAAIEPSGLSGPNLTATGTPMGTPAFMAPEQFEGDVERIGPASDVYSLGATLLYGILTGRAPFEGDDLAAIRDRVRQGEFPGPRVDRRDVPPALEAVCLKAMALRPEDRYPSAASLAADIERWLADEPVTAWREPMTVRARRWARRNRTAVSSAGVALVAGVIGLGTVAGVQTWYNSQLRQANSATTKAKKEVEQALTETTTAKQATEAALAQKGAALADSEESRKRAEAVLGFLKDDVLAAARPVGEKGGLGWDVTIRKAVNAAEPKISEAFKDQPIVEAEVRDMLGETYLYLGEAPLAIRQLERAVELRQTRLGSDHSDTFASRSTLASAYLAAGRIDEAIKIHGAILKQRVSTLGPNHPDTLSSRNDLAVAYQEAGRTDEAIRMQEATLKLFESRLGIDHPDTLANRSNLAVAYREAGRTDEAIRMQEAVLKLSESRLGPNHHDTLSFRNNLARAYQDAGRKAESIAMHEANLKLSELALGPDHPNTLGDRINLAAAYRIVGRIAEAIEMHEATLRKQESRLGTDHPDTLASRNDLALLYRAAGRGAMALEIQDATLKLSESKLGPDHLDTLIYRVNLALICGDVGQFDRAVSLLERVHQSFRARGGPDHPHTLKCEQFLAGAYIAAGRYIEAEALIRAGLERTRRLFGSADPRTAGVLALLGLNLIQQRKWAEAETVLRECLAIREKAAPDDWSRFDTMSQLGGALVGQAKYAEAEPLLIDGYEGMKARAAKIPAPSKPRLQEAAARVVRLYEVWNKPDQATAWKAKLGLADLPADVFARP